MLFGIVTTINSKKFPSPTNIDGFHNIHDTTLCTNVSSWGEVKWIPKTIEKCTTTFIKEPKDRKVEVCDEVTELVCDITPYTECELEWINEDYTVYQDSNRSYIPWVCHDIDKVVQHTKYMPQCHNVTKWNCVTLWKDVNGTKVWAGEEDCEEVTWEKCELAPVTKNFTTVEVDCQRNGDVVPWNDCEEKIKTKMTTQLTCKVLHSKVCTPKVTNKCQTIEYKEWFERPEIFCENVTISMPNQTFEHKEKCLFPHHGSDGGDSASHVHHAYHDHHGHANKATGHATKITNQIVEHIGAAVGANSRSNRQARREQTLNRSNQGRKSGIKPSSSKDAQKQRIRKRPTHPSIDGFKLQAKRNGKSHEYVRKASNKQRKSINPIY